MFITLPSWTRPCFSLFSVGGIVPKLRLRGHEDYCVTYLGGNGKPTKGAPVVLGLCPVSATVTGKEEDFRFGWDFVSERDLVEQSPNVCTTAIEIPQTGRVLHINAMS